MIAPALLLLIQTAADKYGLDPLLIQAMVMTESGGNSCQIRYEPTYRYLWYPRETAEKIAPYYTLQTETVGQMTSWGVMQVMGAVAREYSFMGWFPELCDPQVGLEYGCKHLKKLFDRYGPNEFDAVAAYNAGSPKKEPSGMYRNQRYVDKIYAKLLELRKL